MKQNGQNLFVLLQIVADGLLCAGLAEHDRVDRFEVAGIGNEAHVNIDPVEFAVGACTKMVLHIARTADVFRVGAATRKFVEDNLVGFAHHVGEHVEPAAVGHAVDDLANTLLAAVFDDSFQRRDHGFAAIEAEALGPDVFLAEERFILFAADNRREDGALALVGELDGFFGRLEPFLQEAALDGVRNMHVFQADIAAIGMPQRIVEFADGYPAEAEDTADIDFQILFTLEAVALEREVFGNFPL